MSARRLDLDAIDALASAATMGPLKACGEDMDYWVEDPIGQRVGEFADKADARFFAAARTDVPALVAEVRRLRAQRIADLAEHVGASARWGDRNIELLARIVDLEASEKALHAKVDKGPPPPRSQHSAHDLPEVAAALRAEVDALKAQAATKATTGDAEGAAFATAHPYAAGAILGGIAHRSEGGDRGA